VIDLDGPPDDKADTVTVSHNRLVLPSSIRFQAGKARLAPQSNAVLERVASFLIVNSHYTKVRIEGHIDSRGSSRFNQILTERRAMTVARWLVARGIDCKRLVPVGFGESRPIADHRTVAGVSRSRRIEFHLAAHNGKPIGGLPVDGGGKLAGDPCQP